MREQAESLLVRAANESPEERERIAARARYLESSYYRVLVPSELNASRIVAGADADFRRSTAKRIPRALGSGRESGAASPNARGSDLV